MTPFMSQYDTAIVFYRMYNVQYLTRVLIKYCVTQLNYNTSQCNIPISLISVIVFALYNSLKWMYNCLNMTSSTTFSYFIFKTGFYDIQIKSLLVVTLLLVYQHMWYQRYFPLSFILKILFFVFYLYRIHISLQHIK